MENLGESHSSEETEGERSFASTAVQPGYFIDPSTLPPHHHTRLLILDCQEFARIGVRKVLAQLPWLNVVGEATTLQESFLLVSQTTPDLILMGPRFPDGTGIELCHHLRAEHPTLPIVFLLSSDDEEDSLEAVFQAGASSILFPSVCPGRLIQALDLSVLGYRIYPDSLSVCLRTWIEPQEPESVESPKSLSGLERKLLDLIAQGKTNKEISVVLEVGEKTIKKYLSQLFCKLHGTRRTQAVAFLTKHSV